MNSEVDLPLPAPCIGVFDSGVGGLSVLSALHRHMPLARLLYAADSAHAPYGERDDAFIIERSHAMTAHLLRHGAQMIVWPAIRPRRRPSMPYALRIQGCRWSASNRA